MRICKQVALTADEIMSALRPYLEGFEHIGEVHEGSTVEIGFNGVSGTKGGRYCISWEWETEEDVSFSKDKKKGKGRKNET